MVEKKARKKRRKTVRNCGRRNNLNWETERERVLVKEEVEDRRRETKSCAGD